MTKSLADQQHQQNNFSNKQQLDKMRLFINRIFFAFIIIFKAITFHLAHLMNSILPKTHGVSLKSVHFKEILATQPDIGWFEIHPENYMSDGGLDHYYLAQITERYPLSMHGVGLSLGSYEGVDTEHLQQLKKLIDQYKPAQFSEHLAWTKNNGHHLNDLLPLPLTHEALSTVVQNIHQAQEHLNTTILIENPSTYIDFDQHDYSEAQFLNALCEKTGCGLLLDINNIVVTCSNHNLSIDQYFNEINPNYVGEIHLAGHKNIAITPEKIIKIDDHGSKISDQVWALFENFISQARQHFPVLVEWDTDIPSLDTLVDQSTHAKQLMHNAF